ncbi:aldehyde dehydrogenase (NADP(+)) [soil metagenome]
MEIEGTNLVAGQASMEGRSTFTASDPRTGQNGEVEFFEATADEVDRACKAAARAVGTYRFVDRQARAQLLRSIADRIDESAPQIVELADQETGLGTRRLEGELGRTTGQLRAFGDHISDGSYLDVITDPADPEAGRPDLRRMQIPLGPVAVFGASNFPLAFSVTGGDTASALAAGCPVVVKAHPSHPGTSEMVGRLISDAVADKGLDGGVFSLLQGNKNAVGEALVTHPDITAVGFTGSLAGGRAIFDLAADREVPIPVYAEMGSLNPIFVTPAALSARGDEIAEGLVGSMTLATGQFCTKPGLVFVVDGQDAEAFEEAVAGALSDVELGCLLNESIAGRYEQQTAASTQRKGVKVVATRYAGSDRGLRGNAIILSVSAENLFDQSELLDEHFGPFSIVVRCEDRDQMAEAARQLSGNLAAAVHTEGDHEDAELVDELVDILSRKVGRVIFEGFPTGVAVTDAMHHGGPYPATTSPLYTSVGPDAIRRFLRPVVYQDVPTIRLPSELHNENPTGIWRKIKGELTTAAC